VQEVTVRGIANGRVIDRAVAANRLPDRFLQQQCDHFAANAYHPSGIFGGVFLQAPTTSNSTNRELPRHVLKTCRNRFAGAFYVFHVSGSAGAETARAPARVGPLGDSHCDIVQSSPNFASVSRDLQGAARTLGLRIHLLLASTVPELEAAFASMA
jgi:hypothetical protein